jgi:hypothetical protein
MKNIFLLLFTLSSIYCFSESTKVIIKSINPVEVYKILKFNSEDSESIFPNRRYDDSCLELIGKTPLVLRLENGFYAYNLGGNNRYSTSFNINALGKDVNVIINGDFKKVRKDSYLVLGFGIGTLLSLTTVKLIDDQLDPSKSYIGYLLPITLGCGFSFSMGKWIYDKPRVKVLY